MSEDAFQPLDPLLAVLKRLQSGRISSRALVETALRRIENPDGQGPVAYRQVYRERALRAAERYDQARSRGEAGRLSGIPLSIKDLFDLDGEVTMAGSAVLKDTDPASSNAPVVERLLASQAVLMGRTNMTEFAYSGLGLNPHYGTPLSPWRRREKRIAGGSTSGGAVSVAEGMAVAALGSDTGGSVRIPAAFCGLTGFKATARRIPTTGAFPLSRTLDCIGVIAPTVQCCRHLDRVVSWPQFHETIDPRDADAATPGGDSQDRPEGALPGDDAFGFVQQLGAMQHNPVDPQPSAMLGKLPIGVPESYVMEGLDPEVRETFEDALDRLQQAGADVRRMPLTMLEELPGHYQHGGLHGIEAYALHRELIEESRHLYDPRVAVRIEAGRGRLATDYIDLLERRQAFIASFERQVQDIPLLAWPTVAVLPPRLEDLEDDEAYFSTNLRVLRNTAVTNFLDRPSLSIPLKARLGAPVGFMLSAPSMHDRRLLNVGCAIEPFVTPAHLQSDPMKSDPTL